MIPLLARLGDLVGHKRVLLLSTAVTALGSWWLAFAPTSRRSSWGGRSRVRTSCGCRWRSRSSTAAPRAPGRQELLTRRGAAVLVGSLELAVIIGALHERAARRDIDMNVLLELPAVVVTAVSS